MTTERREAGYRVVTRLKMWLALTWRRLFHWRAFRRRRLAPPTRGDLDRLNADERELIRRTTVPTECPSCGAMIVANVPPNGIMGGLAIWTCVGFRDRTEIAERLLPKLPLGLRASAAKLEKVEPCGWTGRELDRGSLWS